MARHPKILAELASVHWAITPEALGGVLAGVRGELSPDDYAIFHGSSTDDHEALGPFLGEPAPDTKYTRIAGDVGSISINGPIVPWASAILESSGVRSIDRLTKEFAALDANPAIKTIVLVYDSPGGAVTGVSEFASQIANSEKSTISYVFGHAASAAYWLASASDSIVASDTGLVGSIGVVMSIKSEKDDMTVLTSTQSPHKRPDVTTDAGKADIVSILDQLADVFISTVATNRGVSAKTVAEDFGQGAMFGAAAAQSVGMVDKVMPLRNLMWSLQSSDSYAINVPRAVDNTTDQSYSLDDMTDTNPHEDNMDKLDFDAIRVEYASEITAIEDAAMVEGKRAESEKHAEILASVRPVLESASYPESVKTLAFAVLAGKESAEMLRGALIAIDAINAKSEADAAIADSEAVEATPAPAPDKETISTDGVLRSSADADADIDRLREFV